MIRRFSDPIILGVVWAFVVASVLIDVTREVWRTRAA